jgi:hypothetical protein
MGVTMQNNIDIVGQHIGWNMFQPKSQALSLKIDNQRPLGIAVAISAHNRDRRADRAQFIQNDFRTNIAEMPNFIRVARKIDNFLRQLVMSIRYDQDAQCIHFGTADGADNADITSAPRKIIRLNPCNPRLVLPRVIQ